MKNGEKGQALLIVLVIVAFGGLVIAPFLDHADSGLIGSRLYGETINRQYSSDAGVEHAIWGLTHGDLIQRINDSGDNSTSYQLAEVINGFTPDITVVRTDSSTYEITSEAGGGTIRVIIELAGQSVIVRRWQITS